MLFTSGRVAEYPGPGPDMFICHAYQCPCGFVVHAEASATATDLGPCPLCTTSTHVGRFAYTGHHYHRRGR